MTCGTSLRFLAFVRGFGCGSACRQRKQCAILNRALYNAVQPFFHPRNRMTRFTKSCKFLFWCWLSSCLGTQLFAEELPEAKLLEGKSLRGEVAGIDGDWMLTLAAGDEEHHVSATQLVQWGTLGEREDVQHVLLAGGSTLNVNSIEVSRDAITVESKVWQPTKFPLELVRGVVFRPPSDRLARDKLLFNIAGATGIHDRLLLENGDRLEGRLVHDSDQEEGEANGSRYQLETRTGPVAIPRDKVVAITFNPAYVESPSLRDFHCRVGFRDGSRLDVAKFVPQKKYLEMRLAIGIDLKSKPFIRPSPWSLLTMLRPVSPRVVYLSDLPDLGYRHVPFLEINWPLVKDRNVSGGTMRAGDAVYEKGIAMHSTSRVFYELDGQYRRFESDLAIDKSAGSSGSVVCQVVLVNSEGKLEPKFKSKVVRGGEPPIRVSIDVTGAKRLALVVGFADRGDTWDHLNWLHARLIK